MNNENNFIWNEELIQECIDNNQFQKFNIKDKNGDTGFITACIHQPELALEMLDKNNIDFNSQNKGGNTGFITACINQPELAIKMLESNDIYFNIQDNLGDTGFMFACICQPELIIPLLENNKIDTTLKDNDGYTAWDLAKGKKRECFQIYKSYIENQKLSNNISNKTSKSKSLL